jgi:hypothetical protein
MFLCNLEVITDDNDTVDLAVGDASGMNLFAFGL